MKSKDALRALAEVTAYQWGMVTSAQASMRGITRLDLSRLAQGGHLMRVAHGVYMDAGAPASPFDDLRAAWLSTEPKILGAERLTDRTRGVVVASTSAAQLHGIGDLWADRHEFVSPTRRQSQRTEIRYRQRVLDQTDVTLADGLPVMTVERTIADLVDDVGDLSLVAGALRDAPFDLDAARLRDLLAPFAKRHEFTPGDGAALLQRLLEIAGIDTAAIARRVAADDGLGSRIAANYIGRLSATPEMQKTMRSVQASIAAILRDSIAPDMEAARANLSKSGAIDALAKRIAAEFTTSGAMTDASRALARSMSESGAVRPETLAAIRRSQKAITSG